MSEPLPDHAGVRFPPPLIFLGLTMVGPILDRMAGLAPLMFERPLQVGLVIALVAAGLGIALAAIRRFAGARTRVEPWAPSSAIVDDGVYRFTRNPMYLGMALMMFGLALMMGSPCALAMVVAAVIVVDRLVVRREEAYLERKFGDEYRHYRSRVRRWL